MNIIEVAYKWHGGVTKRSRTDFIALHHAEAVKCTPQDIHSWHVSNGWTGIGYHFFVRKDGTIYRGRPLDVVGAHVQGMNSCSIGICAEGDYHTKEKTMPQAQKKSIIELCQYLKKNYYPNAKIVGHREIGDSNCPGRYYPLDEIKFAVAGGITVQAENPQKIALDKLVVKGIITDASQWVLTDFLTNAKAVRVLDLLSGGTWTSEKTNSSIHWAQPNVISLASKDGGSSDGTKVIEDIDGMVNKLNVWISKATLLALVDKLTGGTKEKYKNRKTDHWGRNFLDSLCDKGIITDVKYWDSDFEATVENGVFLVLCCNAFGL